jgi:hypothetical protein
MKTLTKTRLRKATLLAVILTAGLVVGCDIGAKARQDEKSYRDRAFDACIKAGGVPVIGFWSGQVDNCKFPSETNN